MRSRRRWRTIGRSMQQRRDQRPRRPLRRRRWSKRKTMITLTENAAKHVAGSLARRGKGVGLRVGVRTSGCSGLAYKLEYADEIRPEDHRFETHGIVVLVDPKSMPYL